MRHLLRYFAKSEETTQKTWTREKPVIAAQLAGKD